MKQPNLTRPLAEKLLQKDRAESRTKQGLKEFPEDVSKKIRVMKELKTAKSTKKLHRMRSNLDIEAIKRYTIQG